jgi:ATP-dependent RNA helicase RhlB
MGFIPDVRRIVARLPRPGKRLTMLFSATFDHTIMRLVENWMVDPLTFETEPEQVVTDLIEQSFYTVSRNEKLAFLIWLMKNEKFSRMLIFGNRKDSNFRLAQQLDAYGMKCSVLSGDVPQRQRMKILENFRSGKEKIIIATDVAARGIHVDGISHVINYDLPERPEDYVHRIGRTGRAGETGKAISFVCEYGAYVLGAIEEYTGNTANCVLPEDEMLQLEPLPENIRFEKTRNARSGGRQTSRRGTRKRR